MYNKFLMFIRDFPFFTFEALKFQFKGFDIKRYIKFIINGTKNHRIIRHNNKFIIYSFLPYLPSPHFKKTFVNLIDNFYLNTPPKPYLAMISLTSRCPFNCFYCSSKSFNNGDLKKDEVIKILNTLKKMGITMISFTGGEPLLVNYLPEVIKKFSKDFIFHILTSGYNLDKEYARKLKEAGLFGLAFSLDTYESDEFNKIRGSKIAFDTAIKGVEISKSSGIYTMVNSVVTKDKANFEFLDKFLRFLKKLGVDEVRLLEPLPCGNLTHYPSEILNQEERQILLDIQKITFKNKKDYPKTTSLPYIESLWGCGAGNQHVYVDSKGFLHPCNFYFKPFGNLLKDFPEEYFKNLEKIGGFKNHYLCKQRRINEKELYIRDRTLCSQEGDKIGKYRKKTRD